MTDTRCRLCGQLVHIESSDEGTSYFAGDERNAAIEECAKIADIYNGEAMYRETYVGETIAVKIRALKENG